MGLKAGDLDGQVVAHTDHPDADVEALLHVVTGRCRCRTWPVDPFYADSEGRVGRCKECGVAIRIVW